MQSEGEAACLPACTTLATQRTSQLELNLSFKRRDKTCERDIRRRGERRRKSTNQNIHAMRAGRHWSSSSTSTARPHAL